MIFSTTRIAGAEIIDIAPNLDERGFFARTWCQRELAVRGLVTTVAQESISYNKRRGTLRGLHYQRAPHGETKIVRCTQGAIFDVIVDLRPGSPTYLDWLGVELSAENRRALYIPEGLAHGFQTLADDSEIFYQISEFYTPQSAAGCRYDDPALAIAWPLPVTVISERDASWPALDAGKAGGP